MNMALEHYAVCDHCGKREPISVEHAKPVSWWCSYLVLGRHVLACSAKCMRGYADAIVSSEESAKADRPNWTAINAALEVA